MNRPAEKLGLLGAVAVAIATAAGASVDVVAAVGITAGAVPYGVTLLIDNGGIVGAVAALWRGRRRPS